MLAVSVVILFSLTLLYFMSIKYKDSIFDNIDKKKHKLYFLYPMAWYILIKSGLEKRLLSNAEVNKNIRALYVSERHDTQVRLYWCQKISIILLVIFSFTSLSLLSTLKSSLNESGSFSGVLTRPEEEEGDATIRLKFRMENETDKSDYYEDEIVIENKTRIYTDEEWEEVLNKAIPYLEKKMLGKNEDTNNIYTDLNFISEIPGTGIKVRWIPSDYRLISGNGEILNTDKEEKVNTTVTAVLSYKERKVEHTIYLTVCPKIPEGKEALYKKLNDAIEETDKLTDSSKNWSLPDKLGNYIIKWEIPRSDEGALILMLGLFAAVLIWFFGDKDLQKKVNLRNNQMLIDYPEIINKFNLLINAGMTIKQAWIKISEDYIQKKEQKGGEIRYAYEEMIVTLHELKLGIPESQAYEQFGQRIGLLPYMKFSSLLVQNLKKGNKDMIDLLKREVIEAIHERKETVKRLGEEASTKLLGPMAIMLFIVLLVIMIPAFLSIRI